MQDLEHHTILEMYPREKLPKLKLNCDPEESPNRILDEYLHGNVNIPEIAGLCNAKGSCNKIWDRADAG